MPAELPAREAGVPPWSTLGGQPETAPRAYWDAMAKRMKLVFKAPIPDDDIPLIVEYLAKTYGNEQPK